MDVQKIFSLRHKHRRRMLPGAVLVFKVVITMGHLHTYTQLTAASYKLIL